MFGPKRKAPADKLLESRPQSLAAMIRLIFE